MKIGASVILTAIFLPWIGWASMSIINQGADIIRLDVREKTTKELLIELRSDIKEIRKHLVEGK